MTNLIRNGEFYEGEKDWSVSHPEHVKFNEDDCKITSPGYIIQDVIFQSEAKEYALSARMKTESGSTARVILTLHPAGDELELALTDDPNWQVRTDWILAPVGTTGATVRLHTDGAIGVAAAQFGSLTLMSLDTRKSINTLERIVAWWRSLFGARG
ncbi:hypothetical protein FGA82_27105 [Pseudomonas fluorescens]|uniref:hypothetical protein n=1 Tax=Pseudomonas fluorescens TaxID=294 RepID=UPI0011315123|nr:hypothetical protein [Pseudomonas fluorescens]TMU70876.1 hypothetical protein FGA82_27105 [Pseudomonas fluorescens]